MSERALLRRFREGAPGHPWLLVGPGQDCAILQWPPERRLAYKIDQVVEGVHFVLRGPEAASPRQVGWKAMAKAAARGTRFVGHSDFTALHLGLLASAAVVMMAQQGLKPDQQKRRRIWVTALVFVGAMGIVFQGRKSVKDQTAIINVRNFFGVLTVWEEAPQIPEDHKLLLQHGTTFHGLQFQAPVKKLLPTSYYSPTSGIGLLLESMPKQDHRRIGIVGLGVGTIAIYGKPTDSICFYEINPEVERLARRYFTYLSESKADIRILLGDARLTLENQPPQNYDVLVLDAFNSDSVPVHLLTKEAIEIYLKHLDSDGVLAFHISSNYLNLAKVVWRMAEEYHLHSVFIEGEINPQSGTVFSDWILLSRNPAMLATPQITRAISTQTPDSSGVNLWTDDHMNLLQILKPRVQ
jgi:hypothetical protein